MAHGFGRLIETDGSYFLGNYLEGSQDGYGKFFDENGECQILEFKNGINDCVSDIS